MWWNRPHQRPPTSFGVRLDAWDLVVLQLLLVAAAVQCLRPWLIAIVAGYWAWELWCSRSGQPRRTPSPRPAPPSDILDAPTCAQALRIWEAADELFDNRLDWSDRHPPAAPRDLWAQLGAALYGPDDPRVREMTAPAPSGDVE